MEVSLLYQLVPHACVAWKEGAAEGLRPGKRDEELVIPGGGSAGSVAVWLSPWLAEGSQVRDALFVRLVDDAQSCHITTLL